MKPRRTVVLTATLSIGLAACAGQFNEPGSSPDDGIESEAVKVSCPDSPAGDVFENVVCICDDVRDVGELLVGTNTGDPATVGVNGEVHFVNRAEIRGDVVAFTKYSAVTDSHIDGNLITAGGADMVAHLDVGGDLEVGANLSAVGGLRVGGALRVGGESTILGTEDIGSEEAYGNTPAQPCDCNPDTFFDVAGAVAAAATNNDNAAINIGTSLTAVGVNRLDLGSGSYYFDEFAAVGDTQILIDGAVAIYVEGDLTSVGEQSFHIMDGSTLDLYVSGTVATVGNTTLGDPSDPSAFRLYVGGSGSMSLGVGRTRFNGSIYAPEAVLAYVGDTEVRGALFAKELNAVGRLTLGYAAPGDPGDDCPDPGDDDGPDGDPDDPIVQ